VATKKKYPIIGGPLDGEYGDYADFQEGYDVQASWGGTLRDPGEHAAFKNEYVSFNSANGRRNDPSMIWLHKSLLRGTIRA
jgi:hypothetical protein